MINGQLLGNQKYTGFTLVEVMIVILLMTVSILGLLSLISLGMRIDRTANYNTAAIVIAKGLIEEMKDNSDFSTSTITYNDATTIRRMVKYGTDTTTYKCNMKAEAVNSELQKYVVNVYWTGVGGKETNLTLATLKRRDDF
ncbi:MAG: type IV pilus modification protein PilV [bacterium]